MWGFRLVRARFLSDYARARIIEFARASRMFSSVLVRFHGSEARPDPPLPLPPVELFSISHPLVLGPRSPPGAGDIFRPQCRPTAPSRPPGSMVTARFPQTPGGLATESDTNGGAPPAPPSSSHAPPRLCGSRARSQPGTPRHQAAAFDQPRRGFYPRACRRLEKEQKSAKRRGRPSSPPRACAVMGRPASLASALAPTRAGRACRR